MDNEEVVITYLAMKQEPVLRLIQPKVKGLSLLKSTGINTGFYRYLYDAVGRPWIWTDRKKLSDEQLSTILEDDAVDLFVLYVDGTPAGYFELDGREMPTIDLAYFGIMPDFIGLRLGPYLLNQALMTAWEREPEQVTVNTCTLDHPKALPMYQRFGFEVYDQVRVPPPWLLGDPILDDT